MPTSAVLLFSLLLAGDEASCDTVAQCNRLGSEALQQGRFAAATALFEAQVDYAETAWNQAEASADDSKLAHAREIAVNNAALAALKSGDCLRARAWLEAADAGHQATLANRKPLAERCAGKLDVVAHTGEFWQYAGHGAWNSITLRETGDETLQFSAFWMRVGAGPIREYGPAAIGDIEQAFIHVDGQHGRGQFDGYDEGVTCELRIVWVPGGLEIQHSNVPECHIGGAGAELVGKYWRVGEPGPESPTTD
jgi:hypothetical protein